VIDRQGAAVPPAKYREAQQQFQRLLDELQQTAPNK
jgi:hypothetical protein